MRHIVSQIADKENLWAGIPMPLDDHEIIIEPTYPNAEKLAKISGKNVKEEDLTEEERDFEKKLTFRNRFYSTQWRCQITVYEKDGKVKHFKTPAIHHFTQDFNTMSASAAWGIEQENRALQLLQAMVKPHIFRMYALTGMFPETSKRSGLTYIFRRLKPTVVIDARSKRKDQDTRILTALCMHPIAYYSGSWAGAMCPTDDVIAHLSLMRGDEHMYWKRSNQHAPHLPEAGL